MVAMVLALKMLTKRISCRYFRNRQNEWSCIIRIVEHDNTVTNFLQILVYLLLWILFLNDDLFRILTSLHRVHFKELLNRIQ
jgi:hypothetical protein